MTSTYGQPQPRLLFLPVYTNIQLLCIFKLNWRYCTYYPSEREHNISFFLSSAVILAFWIFPGSRSETGSSDPIESAYITVLLLRSMTPPYCFHIRKYRPGTFQRRIAYFIILRLLKTLGSYKCSFDVCWVPVPLIETKT